MIIEVVEGTGQEPDGKPVKLKVLVVTEPGSGFALQIPMTNQQASEIAAGLEGRKVAVAPGLALPGQNGTDRPGSQN